MPSRPTYYEFFAGGGMARAGIGPVWRCLLANDMDPMKARVYADNWGGEDFRLGDVAALGPQDLPGRPDMAWASFPCQDLSLAGSGAGLTGERSGAFWAFWRSVMTLAAEGRRPPVVVLENVLGLLTSRDGRDFAAICEALSAGGYRFGAVVVDAAHFVPQSRRRVFIVAVSRLIALDADSVAEAPHPVWHPRPLRRAAAGLTGTAARDWIWWRLPEPPVRNTALADLVEAEPTGVAWHSAAQTQRLLDLMSDLNRAKLDQAVREGGAVVGTAYRRTRPTPDGPLQRVEIRFDGTAGCLRTPAGGSSRQILVCADAHGVRSRLLSPREQARLMGLADGYVLPGNYNEACHLLGDGLAAPAVAFVMRHLVESVVDARGLPRAA